MFFSLRQLLSWIKKNWQGPGVVITVDGHPELELRVGSRDSVAAIVIRDPSFLRWPRFSPSMILGDAYMKGQIEIHGDFTEALRGFYLTSAAAAGRQPCWLTRLISLFQGYNGVLSGIRNARHHYNVGNGFYKLWLDSTLSYTCAYYPTGDETLEEAQQLKLELVCRKARLAPGMKIIDLGCGWGNFLFYAVEHYGVSAVGVVASDEQAYYIRQKTARLGLEKQISAVTGDWREAFAFEPKAFDRVISIGLMEHVGQWQYSQFFRLIRRLVKDNGFAFIHAIGLMLHRRTDPWIRRRIFPGGSFPALGQMIDRAAKQGFIAMDVENLGQHYARTLADWSANYDQVRPQVIRMYDEEFDRMWHLYLKGSEAAFRWGGLELWQIVFAASRDADWPFDREVGCGRDTLTNAVFKD